MTEQVHDFDLNRLKVSEQNPRTDAKISDSFIKSVKQFSIVEPLLVQKLSGEEEFDYEVISGSRRFEAAKQAKLDEVPCIIRDSTPSSAVQIALVSDVFSEKLPPFDRASAIQYLLDEFSEYFPSQAKLARRLGVDKSTITKWLRPLSFPEEFKNYIGEGDEVSSGEKLSLESLAYIDKNLEDDEKMSFIEQAEREGWSHREIKEQVDESLNVSTEQESLDEEERISRIKVTPEQLFQIYNDSELETSSKFNDLNEGSEVYFKTGFLKRRIAGFDGDKIILEEIE